MSSLRLINETTTTSANYHQINDVFTTDFNIYRIDVTDVDKTNNTWEYLRFVTSSGTVVTSNYEFAIENQSSYAPFSEPKGQGQTAIYYTAYNGSAANHSGGSTIYIYNPMLSVYTFAQWQCSGQNSNGIVSAKGIGGLLTTNTISGFRLFPTTGSYNSFTTQVYGLRVDNG